MADENQKQQLPLKEEIIQKARQKVIGTFATQAGKRVESGESPESVLSSLVQTLSPQKKAQVQRLAQEKIPIAGEPVGLFPALFRAAKGQGFNPRALRTEARGEKDALSLLRTITTLQSPQEAGRQAAITAQEKEQVKRQAGAAREAQGTFRFLRSFERSFKELKEKFPSIGKTGLTGLGTRGLANIQEKLDLLPKTSAFLKQLKPRANQMARDIEGGRVTDQDRKIYAESFANAIAAPSETNVLLASDALIDLVDKGADVDKMKSHLALLAGSEIDIMNQVASNVFNEFPELQGRIKGESSFIALARRKGLTITNASS